jgi:retinol dehydrogenase 12
VTVDGRTFLVTGANTGIGRATATELARRGGTVILACRSEEKTRPVVDDIVRVTGNDQVEFLALDLADLASVRAAADEVLATERPLHVLINNAGVGGQQGLTKQGFEIHFGVNHLGHFLLTTLLLDRLRATARDAGEPSRVVNVSSDSHYSAKTVPFEKLKEKSGIAGISEYAVSKLCNVLFAQELARRVPASEVVSVSLHPGVIASDIWRRVPPPFRWVMTRFMKSTEEGAATSLHCATSPDVLDKSGAFFSESKVKAANEAATPELAAALWSFSEESTAEFRTG